MNFNFFIFNFMEYLTHRRDAKNAKKKNRGQEDEKPGKISTSQVPNLPISSFSAFFAPLR